MPTAKKPVSNESEGVLYRMKVLINGDTISISLFFLMSSRPDMLASPADGHRAAAWPEIFWGAGGLELHVLFFGYYIKFKRLHVMHATMPATPLVFTILEWSSESGEPASTTMGPVGQSNCRTVIPPSFRFVN